MLDEVSQIPLQHQAKILRVLQDGRVRRVGSSKHEAVDARIIATSNRDLEEVLAEGHLRRDLYYRLTVHEIRVPSLREHLEDIPELVAAFLDRWHRANPDLPMPAIDNGAVAALSEYTWPGNVRQLKRTVYRLASRFSGRRITSASIEAMVDSPSQGIGQAELQTLSKRRLDAVERDAMVRALAATGGNKTAAARLLGVSRKTLYNKIRRYGIDVSWVERGLARGGRPRCGPED